MEIVVSKSTTYEFSGQYSVETHWNIHFTRYVMVARTNLEYFDRRVGLRECCAVNLQLADRYGSGGKPP